MGKGYDWLSVGTGLRSEYLHEAALAREPPWESAYVLVLSPT